MHFNKLEIHDTTDELRLSTEASVYLLAFTWQVSDAKEP